MVPVLATKSPVARLWQEDFKVEERCHRAKITPNDVLHRAAISANDVLSSLADYIADIARRGSQVLCR